MFSSVGKSGDSQLCTNEFDYPWGGAISWHKSAKISSKT
jgi:hypothetical protein